jgi:hypothetical protein
MPVVATPTLTVVRGTLTPTSSATASVTPTATPTLTPTVTPPPPTATVVHNYYLSTYETAHEYYCDDDAAWHDISPDYLWGPHSLAQVLQQYPGRTLHKPC